MNTLITFTTKGIFPLTLLVLIFCMLSSHSIAQHNLMIQGNDETVTVASNIICTIKSDKRTVNPAKKRYPIITIQLKNRGPETITINWDKNFGRVLWEGRFYIESKSGSCYNTTALLKNRTGNTYEPRKRISLKKGETTVSTLDFNTLPAQYATGLFSCRGKIAIRLLYKIHSIGKPVSNTLTIKVNPAKNQQ